MEQITLHLPAMYADHHVAEVRRILLQMPGVADVYASSAFQSAEITYDPQQVGPDAINQALEDAGYQGELPIPVESDQPVGGGNGKKVYYRHTSVYENTRSTVSFSHQVSYSGRPLWPCPGMGPLKTKPQEEE
jgi:copper chaperone CopZ